MRFLRFFLFTSKAMARTSGNGGHYCLGVDEAYTKFLEDKIRELTEKNAQLRRRQLKEEREAKLQTAAEVLTENLGTLKRTLSSKF
ncbi:hypothetical protein Nepgr_018286 [Nepenthes gracilis]|uniref:Uncharacterized protein n=1 Tax=Nepenthes gracilis TaxID=150966 RepID=A0AAD3SR10_NEPGR|nr:hypothetical protein Nepgr_018286 [Nepenthes gracilis]